MFNDCLKNELQKVLGCSVECKHVKRMVFLLCAYLLAMLLTFAISSVLASNHFFIASAIFGFLLSLEIIALSTVFSFIIFLAFAYYGAYFVNKGWHRDIK